MESLFIGFFVGAAVFIGAVAVLVAVLARRKQGSLAAYAQGKGFSYTPHPVGMAEELLPALRENRFAIFDDGRVRDGDFSDLISGTVSG